MPKCKICKREIPKGQQYVVNYMSDSGRLYKHNYCSEEEYNEYKKEMDYKNKIYDTLKDYMGYITSQILPPIVLRQITELHNGYSYRVIYNVIRSMESKIKYWMTLDGKFKNEYQKAKYLNALIANNINDEYIKIKREAKIERERKRETVDIDIIEVLDITPTRKNTSDISDFLD